MFTKIDDIPKLLKNDEPIASGLSKTYYIKYSQITNLSFNIENNERKNELLQVNIHSINCNIKVNPKEKIINQTYFSTYSFQINPENENITIEPEIDKIDGEYKENYEKKYCYLSINSYFNDESQSNLKIENKEDNFFYLNSKKNELPNIFYEIKSISDDSFISLKFQFKDSDFSINISYYIDDKFIKSSSKDISNSTNIYLNSDFLIKNEKSIVAIGKNGIIKINIKQKKEIDINMHLKIIEKNTICLLEKNILSFGFLTAKTTYQYYYAEVFEGEEGELMLHNKRFYGELYGKIIPKNETNKILLYDTSIYPSSSSEDGNLEYNPHYLQLKYNYKNTSNCFNGCYLLITYEQYKSNQSEENNTSIGYEFTILSRTWNYTDYLSQIIDIPYNEFILGCFNTKGTQDHYYSFYIPSGVGQILMEIEGNYLDLFYDYGRRRINTINPMSSTKKEDLDNKKEILILNTTSEQILSFILRPKIYYSNIFSFYYFRILYFKENETKYYPIDSYLGNLCLPEYFNEKYYCNFILKFDYNESNAKFAISSTNQHEYFKIYVLKIYMDKNVSLEEKEFIYVNNETELIDYYIFQFEFINGQKKNIITTFEDKIESVYPQIYSAQMFYFNNYNKTTKFSVINDYDSIYQYMYGNSAQFIVSNVSDLLFEVDKNFRGRPFVIPIHEFSDNLTSFTKNDDYIYYYQLIYNNQSKGFEDLTLGEPKSKIIYEGSFPLYFYLELKKGEGININVNIRLSSLILGNDIEIIGYLLNDTGFQSKIDGDYFENEEEQFKGYYKKGFNIGFLQIILNMNNNYSYLLIEIFKKENREISSPLLVDIITKDHSKDIFWIPINRYILDTFIDTNNIIKSENRYHININNINESNVIIELSAEYDDIEIKFENLPNIPYEKIGGFKKYRIEKINKTDSDKYNIYFNVSNTAEKKENTNFMIKYYYVTKNIEFKYFFNETVIKTINEINDKETNITLTLNNLEAKAEDNNIKDVENNLLGYIITGILYESNSKSKEIINTTSRLNEHKELAINSTEFISVSEKKWNLSFNNFPKDNNFNCDLQLRINALISKSLFNEKFIVFAAKVDLTDIKPNKAKIWIIIGSILGAIVIGLIVIFVIKYIKLRKKNSNLKIEMLSMAFSNDVHKNVLSEENKISKNDSDYESTFI